MRPDEFDPLLDAVCEEIGNILDGNGLNGAGMLARIVGKKTSPTEHSREVCYGRHIGYGFFMPQYPPEQRAGLVPKVGQRSPHARGVCVYREYDENGFGIYIADVSLEH
jgi:hypothetical protein